MTLMEQIEREMKFIEDREPPCPDPGEGGCIGSHCIRCARREIKVLLSEFDSEWKRRESNLLKQLLAKQER